MLTTCPECELPVSDKAISCPHCGYPLQATASPRSPTKRKHKRLPNGFGQITKISNLRNPYRAMVTVAKSETGKPIQKLLKPKSYFATYNEAYTALLEYNKNPFDLSRTLTVKEIYELWYADYQKKNRSIKTIRNHEGAWKNCEQIYNIPIRQLKSAHLKACINAEGVAPNVRKDIKVLFNILLDYALENEYVDHNCARSFKLSEEISEEIKRIRKPHSSFTEEEMGLLWQHLDDEDVQTVLIQCYTGFRPTELLQIKLENVDLEQNIIVGGMKTKAGIDRIVPIHPSIQEFVRTKYQLAQQGGFSKLITFIAYQSTAPQRKEISYSAYFYKYKEILARCGITAPHEPHDPRKQFVTMAKKYKVEDYAIKRIVGHHIDDITEAIYTDRSVDWLYEEICKIPETKKR